MGNLNLKIDLLKIRGAKKMDIQGKTTTKPCIVIPIDRLRGTVVDSYVDREGVTRLLDGVYLNAVAYEMREPHNGNTHIIKESLSKEALQKSSEEDLRAMPIIGNIRPWSLTVKKVEDMPADAMPSEDDW